MIQRNSEEQEEEKGGEKRGIIYCVFFFKQKTANEIRLSLVGSEMCIRDRGGPPPQEWYGTHYWRGGGAANPQPQGFSLYTSAPPAE